MCCLLSQTFCCALAGNVPKPFQANSRVGIDGTLHRISAMTDSYGEVIGLTYRVGRYFPGAHLRHVSKGCYSVAPFAC